MDTDGYFSFLDSAWGGEASSGPGPAAPRPTASSRRRLGETASLTNSPSMMVSPPIGYDPINTAAVPPPRPSGGDDPGTSLSGSPLSLAYTLVIGTGIMAAFIVIHLLANWMYRRLIGSDLPDALVLPCLDTQLLCLILMAVTFPAFLCLGSGRMTDALSPGGAKPAHGFAQSDGLAVFVLVALVVPFTVFLWWITLSRIFLGAPSSGRPSDNTPGPGEESPVLLMGVTNVADDPSSGASSSSSTPLDNSRDSVSSCYDCMGDIVSSEMQLVHHSPGE